ncbi:ABC transporter related [Catenulispora acidiphila DSM 44928]|uniref:ABC transporter related n=1 Tax=Catenulispora acidiphila (strain DSM 44928 / JCM 14897 / NBRC 102108 / NRRL B-24433 / ID139908) TaxID=479433 RepID=C7Q104_CATAD|nr:ABC transporter ATP-binding protein [Catenulispora acidiphila]ACU71679.1 ABC transporter related [Catenulispora acidiphila DSM 44928]
MSASQLSDTAPVDSRPPATHPLGAREQQTASTDGRPTVLSVADLRVEAGGTELVRGVSFTVGRGEIVGLVGASGSGKTLTCRAVLGLLAPGCVRTAGEVRLGESDLTALDRRGWDAVRGARVGTVFQDPASYLNPSVTVGRQVTEALRLKAGLDRRATRTRALDLLTSVGLRDPETVYHAYPHELSGGMAQRVLIAIAVSGDPELLVADEPTSSLDALVQAGVLGLLRRLVAERGLALLLVTHDLAVVAELCDRVLVCDAGQIVEQGSAASVVGAPAHPRTRALIDAAAVWHREPAAGGVR